MLLTLTEAQRGYRAFRIVPLRNYRAIGAPEYNFSETVTMLPSVPASPMSGEDRTIPRVALSKTILGCLAGVIGTISPKRIENTLCFNTTRYSRAIEEARSAVNGRYMVFGLPNEDSSVLLSTAQIRQHVPDARTTGEVWSLEPVTLRRLGVLVRSYDGIRIKQVSE